MDIGGKQLFNAIGKDTPCESSAFEALYETLDGDLLAEGVRVRIRAERRRYDSNLLHCFFLLYVRILYTMAALLGNGKM